LGEDKCIFIRPLFHHY